MSGRQMAMRAVTGIIFMGGASGSLALRAGEAGAGGTATGVLASKGETWIGVKSEGQDEAALYLPVWKGGLPKDGGGFDKETLALIKSLVVGSRVKVVWKALEEHPRISSIEVLALPEKKAEAAAAPEKTRSAGVPRASPPVAPEKADSPKVEAGPKQGVASGQVTAKGESWIEIRDKDSQAQQFYVGWLGGEGGGPDKEMMKQIGKVNTGDFVEIEWVFQDRHMVIKKLTSASQR